MKTISIRPLSAVLLLLLLAAAAGAQESDDSDLLFAYQRNFARGSLSTKVQVLQDAAESGEAGIGKLYHQAIEFYLDNANTLGEDATAIELAKLAARLIGREQYRPATESLWQLFGQSEETGIKVAIINSLGEILEPEQPLVQNIQAYLKLQNENYLQGKEVDLQLISETVVALGKVGDIGSFPVIFAALHIGYPQKVEQQAASALEKLEGNTVEMVLEVLETGFAKEKKPVLEWSMEKENFSREELGSIAEKALQVGLEQSTRNAEIDQMIRDLRYAAAGYLADLEWSEATPLLIEHFDQTNIEVDRGLTSTSNLLEAIAALGAMSSHEAAVRLSLYLEVLNTYMENGQRVDEQVVLAVIRNLGRLGDNVAFDPLLYAMYLDYPRSVKQAAREVLSDFKQ